MVGPSRKRSTSKEFTLAGAQQEIERAYLPKKKPERSPNTVVVLRTSMGRGRYVSLVWTGKSPRSVMSRALKVMSRERRLNGITWTPELDKFVLTFYNNGMSTSEMVGHLKAMSRQKFTKNVIIGRYHRVLKHKGGTT